jgi:hypothetical protein
MLLLTTTSDSLQLVTDSAASLDVHATYIDTFGGAITPGRNNTHIASAATTVVVAPPAASAQRNVKTLHVRNRDASLSCNVTVQINDAGGPLALFAVLTLTPGEMFEMVDMGGLKVQR